MAVIKHKDGNAWKNFTYTDFGAAPSFTVNDIDVAITDTKTNIATVNGVNISAKIPATDTLFETTAGDFTYVEGDLERSLIFPSGVTSVAAYKRLVLTYAVTLPEEPEYNSVIIEDPLNRKYTFTLPCRDHDNFNIVWGVIGFTSNKVEIVSVGTWSIALDASGAFRQYYNSSTDLCIVKIEGLRY